MRGKECGQMLGAGKVRALLARARGMWTTRALPRSKCRRMMRTRRPIRMPCASGVGYGPTCECVTCVRKRGGLQACTRAHAGTNMHSHCTAQGPRPANLEIIDEDATVVEHVCQQCYEAPPETPVAVTKPRRMPWMVDEPEW